MAGNPNVVAPSSRSAYGMAREITTGTALMPSAWIPMDAKSYKPEDTPKFLPDEAIRAVMAQLFNEVLGPEDATFSFGGPNFLDTYGFPLDNAFGDLSTTGSSGTAGTSLSAATSVGATTATVGAITGYGSASTVQIDSGTVSEVVVLSTAPSGSAITFANSPLRFAHSSGATVSAVSAPYTHTFALLNSSLGYGGVAGAQPPTHTITDLTNLNYSGSTGGNTTGARSYPSACVSKIDFTGNAEQLMEVKFSGNSWVSAPASSAPSPSFTSVVPVAAWRSTVKVGGVAVETVGEWAINVTRKLQVYWTAQGSQNPYIIARGELGIAGTMNFTAPADESPLAYMLYEGPQQVLITISNGKTGASELSLTFTATNAQFVKSSPTRNAVLVGFDTSFECIANSTDVGGSGGLGPGTFQMINSQPTY